MIAKDKILIRPFKYDEKDESGTLFMMPHYRRLSYKAEVIEVSKEKGIFDCCEVGDIILCDRNIGIDVENNLEIIDQSEVICKLKNGKYEIPYNHALIKLITQDGDNNLGLHIDTSFEKEKYAITFGKVVVPPKKLLYFGKELENKDDYSNDTIVKMNQSSIQWNNKDGVAIEYDDIVHFHYLSLESAEGSGLVIKDEETGDDLYLIRYDLLYALERKSEIKFINGYCGVDIEEIPFSYKDKESNIYISNTDEKNRKKWGIGRIVFMGTPNSDYLHHDCDETKVNICLQDIVNFKFTKKMKIGNDKLLLNKNLKDIHLIQIKDVNFVY